MVSLRSRVCWSALVLSLALGLALGGCYDPHKKYTLDPASEVRAGEGEKSARAAAPFADDLVRYLRGKPRDRGNVFVLQLAFGPGDFAPRIDTIGDLEAMLVIMRDYPDLRIAIEGHTDDEGDEKKNLRLSQRRADWVRSFLLERGIDGKRVRAQGFGDSDPIADNSTPEGQQKNRRLMVRVLNFESSPASVEISVRRLQR